MQQMWRIPRQILCPNLLCEHAQQTALLFVIVQVDKLQFTKERLS